MTKWTGTADAQCAARHHGDRSERRRCPDVLGLRALLDNRETLGPAPLSRCSRKARRRRESSRPGDRTRLAQRQRPASPTTLYLVMVPKKDLLVHDDLSARAGALIGGAHGVDPEQCCASVSSSGPPSRSRTTCSILADAHLPAAARSAATSGRDGGRSCSSTSVKRDRARSANGCPGFSRSRGAERASDDVSWVRQMMDDYGCLDHARRVAHGLADAARVRGRVPRRAGVGGPEFDVRALCRCWSQGEASRPWSSDAPHRSDASRPSAFRVFQRRHGVQDS